LGWQPQRGRVGGKSRETNAEMQAKTP